MVVPKNLGASLSVRLPAYSINYNATGGGVVGTSAAEQARRRGLILA